MTDSDIIDRYCALVVESADKDVLLEFASRMSDDEKMRALFRLIEKQDRKAAMDALAAWRAAGGRWLHS